MDVLNLIRRGTAAVGERMAAWGRGGAGDASGALPRQRAREGDAADGEPTDRRGLGLALAALAAAGATASVPRQADAQWAVFDAANLMQMLQELAQVSELIRAAIDTRNLISEVKDGIGEAVDLINVAPEIAEALSLLDAAGDACGEFRGLFGLLSRGGYKVALNLPRGLMGSGDICAVFDAPATAMNKVRRQFEPAAGLDLAGLQKVARQRTAEYRQSVYGALGTSYHSIAAGTKCHDQLKKLSGMMGGSMNMKRQQATGNAISMAILEEVQTLNRQFSAFLRLQAARELKDESLENYQPIPEEA